MKRLFIISSYPEKNQTHGKNTVGVASYTKNTLKALTGYHKDLRITVWAETLEKEEVYKENGMIIKRVWKRGSFASLWSLYKAVNERPSDGIIVPFEGYMFGNMLHALFFVYLLLLWKLNKKKIYLILHQVIADFRPFEKKPVKAFILNLARAFFYPLLLFVSFRTIVFEKKFKELLHNDEKVVVISHAVETMKKIGKTEARKKLRLKKNSFYVLSFGYISPYKGMDSMVNMWEKYQNVHLILAGGHNPNHANKRSYSKFVTALKKKAHQKGIITTGFVSEKRIPLYFSACDLVVLPYKTFMSSSGPLSIAFSFEKPVLLSKALEGYFDSNDFQKSLRENPVSKSNLVFKLNKEDFYEKMNWIRKNLEKTVGFSKTMKEARSWERIGKKYAQVLSQ